MKIVKNMNENQTCKKNGPGVVRTGDPGFKP